MEGQTHKIRTMARDLEQIKQLSQKKEGQPVPEPIKRPLPESTAKAGAVLRPPKEGTVLYPPKKPQPARLVPPPIRKVQAEQQKIEEKKPEIRLSDILKGARKRVEEGTFDRGVRPADEAPHRMAQGEAGTQKTYEDILPIEPAEVAPPKIEVQKPSAPRPQIEPPPNLPTGEPASPAGEPVRPTPEKSTVLYPSEGGAVLRPPEEPKGKTPEEILGLPTGKAKAPEKLPTPLPDKPAPEKMEKQRPGGLPTLKFAAIAGVLSIILVAMLGGLYWNFFIKKPPEQTSELPEPTMPIEQPKPLALLQYDYEHIIEIDELNYDVLKTNIAALQDVSFPAESVIYIPIKYTTEDEIRYIEPKELFEMLEINVPAGIFDYGEATLFLYIQGAEAQEICASAEIINGSCYGPRLGIAIEIDQKEAALALMSEWEMTLVNDLNPLILAEYEVPDESIFKIGSYEDLETHYLNLSVDEATPPITTTSIDWVLANNYLIIATSKDAARAAVDNLIPPVPATTSKDSEGEYAEFTINNIVPFKPKTIFTTSQKKDETGKVTVSISAFELLLKSDSVEEAMKEAEIIESYSGYKVEERMQVSEPYLRVPNDNEYISDYEAEYKEELRATGILSMIIVLPSESFSQKSCVIGAQSSPCPIGITFGGTTSQLYEGFEVNGGNMSYGSTGDGYIKINIPNAFHYDEFFISGALQLKYNPAGGTIKYTFSDEPPLHEKLEEEAKKISGIPNLPKPSYLPNNVNNIFTSLEAVEGMFEKQYSCDSGGVIHLIISGERYKFSLPPQEAEYPPNRLEEIAINGESAYILEEWFSSKLLTRKLFWDPKDEKVQIDIYSIGECIQPKEELVKIAESMK